MKNKKLLIYMVLVLFVIVAGGVTVYFWYNSRHYVSTEDAQIDGEIIRVSPQVAGRLVEVNVKEGDYVQAGDVVARQDDVTLTPGTRLDLTLIRAPISGVVIGEPAHVGEVVAPGQQVAMLVDPSQLYVTANVEETDLYKVKPGQKVDFTVDSIPGIRFTGRVRSVENATKATFSLLPSSNASGNFTKVTQRVPVKITLDDTKGQKLTFGTNVVVRIHIR